MTEPPPPTSATTWRTAGRDHPRVGAVDAVTGRTVFPSDVSVPGMLHGARLRPPRIGATLRSADTSDAAALEGVTVVEEDDVIGAVAATPPEAQRAVAAIRAEWHLEPRSMAWEGKSAAYICRQILDPHRNGGHDKDVIVEHLKGHPLVRWAWSPGAGRESAPGTWQEFNALIDAWDKSGAKCP